MIQVLCFARSARTSARLELCSRREIRFINVFVRVTIAFFGQTESDRVEFAIGLTKLLLTCWEAWEVLADIFVLDERGTPTACTEMFDA